MNLNLNFGLWFWLALNWLWIFGLAWLHFLFLCRLAPISMLQHALTQIQCRLTHSLWHACCCCFYIFKSRCSCQTSSGNNNNSSSSQHAEHTNTSKHTHRHTRTPSISPCLHLDIFCSILFSCCCSTSHFVVGLCAAGVRYKLASLRFLPLSLSFFFSN